MQGRRSGYRTRGWGEDIEHVVESGSGSGQEGFGPVHFANGGKFSSDDLEFLSPKNMGNLGSAAAGSFGNAGEGALQKVLEAQSSPAGPASNIVKLAATPCSNLIFPKGYFDGPFSPHCENLLTIILDNLEESTQLQVDRLWRELHKLQASVRSLRANMQDRLDFFRGMINAIKKYEGSELSDYARDYIVQLRDCEEISSSGEEEVQATNALEEVGYEEKVEGVEEIHSHDNFVVGRVQRGRRRSQWIAGCGDRGTSLNGYS